MKKEVRKQREESASPPPDADLRSQAKHGADPTRRGISCPGYWGWMLCTSITWEDLLTLPVTVTVLPTYALARLALLS